jgi:hypothetical protein
MKTYKHIANWREERGSSLDRAKKLVSAPDSSVKAISDLTGINYQTVANYRQKPDTLDKATWQKVDALGRAYDYFEVAKLLSEQDMLFMQRILHDLFADLYDSKAKEPRLIHVVSTLEKMTASDPVMIYNLFKAFMNYDI